MVAVSAEEAARQHSGSLGGRRGSLSVLAAAEAQWQQPGGGSSALAAAAAAQQRSNSLGGNGGREGQLGDRAVLAGEEAWRVSQWQRCRGKCGGGSTVALAAQWWWQCGGGGSVVAAALQWWQHGSNGGSAAVAAAREVQWAARHQRSGSGCRRGPPFNNNNVTMEFG
jgi:hypothetical protein